MLLVLTEEHKHHLSFLTRVGVEGKKPAGVLSREGGAIRV